MRAASSALALLVTASGVARAAPSPADVQFKAGRELMKLGKYAAACAAFEESQRLDPSSGTQFNLAQCDEKTGKLASALAIYRDLAAHDANPTRKAAAADLASKLAPRVPTLAVQLEPQPPGVTVVIDGVSRPCSGTPCLSALAMDLGTYAVVARAPGFVEARATAAVTEEGQPVTVTLRLEPAPTAPVVVPAPVAPVATEPLPPLPPPARSRRKPIGIAGVVVGGAGLAGAIALGVVAHGRWSDAKAVCGGSTTCATQADLDHANQLSASARSAGNLATAFAIGGAVIAAGGAALWLTAPQAERPVQLGAAASPTSLGLVLSGRF